MQTVTTGTFNACRTGLLLPHKVWSMSGAGRDTGNDRKRPPSSSAERGLIFSSPYRNSLGNRHNQMVLLLANHRNSNNSSPMVLPQTLPAAFSPNLDSLLLSRTTTAASSQLGGGAPLQHGFVSCSGFRSSDGRHCCTDSSGLCRLLLQDHYSSQLFSSLAQPYAASTSQGASLVPSFASTPNGRIPFFFNFYYCYRYYPVAASPTTTTTTTTTTRRSSVSFARLVATGTIHWQQHARQ